MRRIPLSFLRDVGLQPLLDSALRNGHAERTVHQQDAVDGLPRRHRGRTDCLRQKRQNFSDTGYLGLEHVEGEAGGAGPWSVLVSLQTISSPRGSLCE